MECVLGSQLRDHACWYFAPAVQNGTIVNANSIRTWMGDFGHIRSVAKYAARLGQCFSSTMPVEVSKYLIKEIPDIERNGYCFSDGIGRISRRLAETICKELGLDYLASAFQVRLSSSHEFFWMLPQIGFDV
jgi:RNA-dependent RNA polymerase